MRTIQRPSRRIFNRIELLASSRTEGGARSRRRRWTGPLLGVLLLGGLMGGAAGHPGPVAASSSSATAITVGEVHTCALLADGTVRCWGYNRYGQLGNGTTTDSSTPVAVSGVTTATAIAAGDYQTCALLSGGSVVCWGGASYGVLGDGTTTTTSTPVTVSGINSATAIAAGELDTCALLADRTVRCWGDNTYGELGDGTNTSSPTPVTVFGISTATAIAVGGGEGCAILADATVRCWGYNDSYQLGDGTTTNRSSPVTVIGISTATGIAAGSNHTCALLADHGVRCWGLNVVGALGDGTIVERDTPVAVSGVTTATAIAAGYYNSCVLLADRTVSCWGDNGYGELGDGTTTYRTMPVTTSGITTATAIATMAHSCATLADGTARCWGDNSYGQLGDGTTTNSAVPVTVQGLPAGTDVVVPGTAWFGTHGVNVCFPAGDGSATSCGANQPPVGIPWQCVELAQRFLQAQGWWSGVFSWSDASGGHTVWPAKQIATWAQNTPSMKWNPANSGYVPAPGDLIVTDGDATWTDGHVSVVDRTDRTNHLIYAIEQNRSTTGSAVFTYTASSITMAPGLNPQPPFPDNRPILGTVHVRSVQASATPSTGGSVHLPEGTALDLAPTSVAASGTLSLTTLSSSQIPDPIPTNWLLQGQAVAVGLPTLQAGASAQLTFTYDPSSIPSGYTVAIYQDGDWTKLPTAFSGNTVSAQINASTGYAVLAEPNGSTYHALTPTRILDTRYGTGLSGTFSSHVARTFQVTGGTSGVPSNATAITGNLTVTQQTSLGFLYLGPNAANNPTSSTLNFPVGDDRANAVTVALGAGGTLSATYAASTLGPSAQVIFDVTGYFTPDSSGATYHTLTPTRLLDSRYGTGLSGAFSSHVTRTFQVTGQGGVPSNATAVTGNLTVTGQTSLGYLAIGPVAMNNPTSSTLNFPLGDDRANAVTVALGAGGTLSVTYAAPTLGQTAHVIFDVTGYFTPDASGAVFVPLTPTRVLDSRDGTGGLSGAFSSHVARTFTVTGHASVPTGAIAVTGNLTVTQQTNLGYLSIGPVAQNNPTSSTLNFPLNDDRANAVTVALGGGGTLSVAYAAPTLGKTAHVIFDVTGYFVP